MPKNERQTYIILRDDGLRHVPMHRQNHIPRKGVNVWYAIAGIVGFITTMGWLLARCV